MFTLSDDAVPTIFREPFIRFGYRPPYQPWFYYLRSLFHMHNETINVWSHLVAALLFTARAYDIVLSEDVFADPRGWALLAFAIGAIAYAMLSCLAHLFQSRFVQRLFYRAN